MHAFSCVESKLVGGDGKIEGFMGGDIGVKGGTVRLIKLQSADIVETVWCEMSKHCGTIYFDAVISLLIIPVLSCRAGWNGNQTQDGRSP